MIKLLLILLLSGSAMTAFAGSEPPPQAPRIVAVGSVAPDFTLENTKGEKIRLSGLRGKVVIVNFWATWCPPCRQEMPSMETVYQTFAEDDLVLLAINVEKEGRTVVADFLKETPYSFPILYDENSRIQDLYGVYQLPESFILDRNGVVVKKIIGAVHWMGGDLYNLLHFMTKG